MWSMLLVKRSRWKKLTINRWWYSSAQCVTFITLSISFFTTPNYWLSKSCDPSYLITFWTRGSEICEQLFGRTLTGLLWYNTCNDKLYVNTRDKIVFGIISTLLVTWKNSRWLPANLIELLTPSRCLKLNICLWQLDSGPLCIASQDTITTLNWKFGWAALAH